MWEKHYILVFDDGVDEYDVDHHVDQDRVEEEWALIKAADAPFRRWWPLLAGRRIKAMYQIAPGEVDEHERLGILLIYMKED